MIDEIKTLVTKMTLEEKAGLCSGYDFWSTKLSLDGFLKCRQIYLSQSSFVDDRIYRHTSHFLIVCAIMSAVNLASSWSMEMASKMGDMLGKECLDP